MRRVLFLLLIIGIAPPLSSNQLADSIVMVIATPGLARPPIASDAAPATLQVTFEAAAITVHGATPGGRVVVLSIVRHDRQLYYEVARREYVLTDDDRNGAVRLALPGPLPADSLWAVAEPETGAYAIAAPDGSPFVSLDATPHGWKGGVDGQLDRLEISREWIELLWCRQGVGCYAMTNGDGGSFDSDHKSDGRISTEPAQMRPIGDSPPPPKRFLPKDLVIVVDPRGLRYFVAAVPK